MLPRALHAAMRQLEAFDQLGRGSSWGAVDKARMIVALASTGIEALASHDGSERLGAAAAAASHLVRDRSLSHRAPQQAPRVEPA